MFIFLKNHKYFKILSYHFGSAKYFARRASIYPRPETRDKRLLDSDDAKVVFKAILFHHLKLILNSLFCWIDINFNEHLTFQTILLLLKITWLLFKSYYLINYKLITAVRLCLICYSRHNYDVKVVSVLKVIWQVIRDSSHFLTEYKKKSNFSFLEWSLAQN